MSPIRGNCQLLCLPKIYFLGSKVGIFFVLLLYIHTTIMKYLPTCASKILRINFSEHFIISENSN